MSACLAKRVILAWLRKYSLVRGLAQVLLGSVELGLEQVHLALQRFRVGGVRLVLLARRLVLVQLALELVQIALGYAQLVLQRRDLLVLGEQLLLELLVLGCQLIGTLAGSIRLHAQRVEFLVSAKSAGVCEVLLVSLFPPQTPLAVALIVKDFGDAHLLDAVLLVESWRRRAVVIVGLIGSFDERRG